MIATGVRVHTVGDIADGVDIGNVGFRVLIDPDGPLVVEFHAHLLETQAIGVGVSSRGIHDQIRRHGLIAGECDLQVLAHLRNPLDLRPDAQVDAFLADLLGERRTHVVIETAEDLLGPDRAASPASQDH